MAHRQSQVPRAIGTCVLPTLRNATGQRLANNRRLLHQLRGTADRALHELSPYVQPVHIGEVLVENARKGMQLLKMESIIMHSDTGMGLPSADINRCELPASDGHQYADLRRRRPYAAANERELLLFISVGDRR